MRRTRAITTPLLGCPLFLCLLCFHVCLVFGLSTFLPANHYNLADCVSFLCAVTLLSPPQPPCCQFGRRCRAVPRQHTHATHKQESHASLSALPLHQPFPQHFVAGYQKLQARLSLSCMKTKNPQNMNMHPPTHPIYTPTHAETHAANVHGPHPSIHPPPLILAPPLPRPPPKRRRRVRRRGRRSGGGAR